MSEVIVISMSKHEFEQMLQEKIETCLDRAASNNHKNDVSICLYPTMKTSEVAQYLRVTTKTVLNWAKSGRLPYHRTGHQFTFKSEDVKKLGEINKQ